MFKREIAEIKKTMSPQECNISRILSLIHI